MNCHKAVAIVLLMLVALEILPCALGDDPSLSTGWPGSFACSIEPLQVCDHGDSLLGAQANFPVLVPGAPVLILLQEVLCLVHEGPSFASDGFRPSIDHPPQLSA